MNTQACRCDKVCGCGQTGQAGQSQAGQHPTGGSSQAQAQGQSQAAQRARLAQAAQALVGGVELRFTLRAHRGDRRNRRVLAWREFDPRIAAPSDEPTRKHNP